MKILHILDHSLPLHSGYTFRSQSIFRAQRTRGWHPVVLTSPKHEQSWKGHWQEKEEIDGFSYYRTGASRTSRLPGLGEFGLMRNLARRIRNIAALEKPNLIHAHSPVLNGLPAIRAGLSLRLPVVYEIRAFWEDAAVDLGTYTQDSWKYRLTRALETWVCRRAGHVAVLCQGLKQDLMARGIPAEKLTPVFNGINPEDFKPTSPDAEFQQAWGLAGKKVIGFIGSFYHYEGLDLLLSAFSKLAANMPNVVLLLVGGGQQQDNLGKQIQKLGLQDRVILPGRIPHERIPGVYALVDVLAYPRLKMRLTDLVTPLKPLEAMAMGKALVASDVGGHLELIRDGQTGLLFPAGDVAALTRSLSTALLDDNLRRHLENNGPAWVREHHTWERTTRVYEEIYQKAAISHLADAR
jgi:PEP-CTERM/exosortase A-associated glycosyltransferase